MCLTDSLPEPIPPHVNLRFPLLPVCVASPREQDVVAPFSIGICDGCGLIMLLDVVDPSALYDTFHSDGIGSVWEAHYAKFSKLIFKHHRAGRLLEIGSGQGKLLTILQAHYTRDLEVLDPQYVGPREHVTVHDSVLNSDFVGGNMSAFGAVVSSHTLEHFIDFNDYFRDCWKVLRDGGMLFTSVPNQEIGFAKGYGNQLNFEHPSACTNAHWIKLHYDNGFAIRDLSFFRDHSVQIAAQKVRESTRYELDAAELSREMLAQYEQKIHERIATIRERATGDAQNWVFGASNFTQPLFVYGLDESVFEGVMDNSPFKHNKRLYGTSLICRKPEDVVSGTTRLRVFLNVGHYNAEVKRQLMALSTGIELVAL